MGKGSNREDELRALYSTWETEQLERALTKERTQYEPLAVALIEAEFSKRGKALPAQPEAAPKNPPAGPVENAPTSMAGEYMTFASESSATAAVAHWRQTLPEVRSAYRPSGKLPISALLPLLCLGLIGGAVAAAIAAGITAVVGGLILQAVASAFPAFFWPGFVILVLLIARAAGLAASAVVSAASRVGKNRNAVISGATGFLAASAGVVLLHLAASALANMLPLQRAGREHQILYLAILAVLAGVFSLNGSISSVQETKFCETCDEFMKSRTLCALSFQEVVDLVKALQQGVVKLDSFLHTGPRSDATATLLECKKCKSGLLEVGLDFRAKWPLSELQAVLKGKGKYNMLGLPTRDAEARASSRSRGGYGKKEASWRVVSRALNPQEREALAADPNRADIWINKGVALTAAGRREEAVVAYERALGIDPKSALAWNNKGAALQNLGRFEEALVTYDGAATANPNYDHPWINKGVVLGKLKRWQEALAAFERAVSINPKSAPAWNNKAVALQNLVWCPS